MTLEERFGFCLNKLRLVIIHCLSYVDIITTRKFSMVSLLTLLVLYNFLVIRIDNGIFYMNYKYTPHIIIYAAIPAKWALKLLYTSLVATNLEAFKGT